MKLDLHVYLAWLVSESPKQNVSLIQSSHHLSNIYKRKVCVSVCVHACVRACMRVLSEGYGQS